MFEKAGVSFSGVSPDNELVEAIELDQRIHPFFVGVQFHPEYKSRPLSPHPIFLSFIKAAAKTQKAPLIKEETISQTLAGNH